MTRGGKLFEDASNLMYLEYINFGKLLDVKYLTQLRRKVALVATEMESSERDVYQASAVNRKLCKGYPDIRAHNSNSL